MAVAEKEIISASQDERSILDHAQDVLLSSKDRIPKLVGPDGDEIPLPPSLQKLSNEKGESQANCRRVSQLLWTRNDRSGRQRNQAHWFPPRDKIRHIRFSS